MRSVVGCVKPRTVTHEFRQYLPYHVEALVEEIRNSVNRVD